MAAANKPLVVIIAFLLAAAAAVPLPDGGGNLPFTLLPAEPPAAVSSLPNGGGTDLPFTLLQADPAAAAGCRGSVGMCPARDEVPGLGGGAGAASTMAADLERVRRRVHHQQRDSVPCSRRGASYYNCRPGGAQANNPYRRACSRIKHCHG